MDDQHAAGEPEDHEDHEDLVGRSDRPYSPVDPQINPSADQSRPDYQPREGLSGAHGAGAAQPKRKRALPRSQVTLTLRLLIALVLIAALIGLFV